MIARQVGIQGRLRTLACLLALMLPLGAFCFGAGQSGQGPAGKTEKVRLSSIEGPGSDISGGIEPGSALALKIEKKNRIRIITPSGSHDIRRPVITVGGVKPGQGEPAIIPWTEIQKIRLPKKATFTGTWIGFGLGAALGIAWASEGGAESGGDYLLAASILGGMGAVSGALIGTLITDWKTVYTAPANPPPDRAGIPRAGAPRRSDDADARLLTSSQRSFPATIWAMSCTAISSRPLSLRPSRSMVRQNGQAAAARGAPEATTSSVRR